MTSPKTTNGPEEPVQEQSFLKAAFAIIGFLLTIVVGIGGWTLSTVHGMSVQQAILLERTGSLTTSVNSLTTRMDISEKDRLMLHNKDAEIDKELTKHEEDDKRRFIQKPRSSDPLDIQGMIIPPKLP